MRRHAPDAPLAAPPPGLTDLDAYTSCVPFVPDCLFLDHLTVSGCVRFGKGVVLRGTVIIVAGEGGIDVPAGSLLENKIITGALRILDH